MKTIAVIGKYLDQPILVAKFSKAVPTLLVAGSTLYGANHIQKTPKEQRRKESIKTISVLAATIASALIAPKLTTKIIKEAAHDLPVKLKDLKKSQRKLVDDFLAKNKVEEDIIGILTKAKDKVLSFPQVKKLEEALSMEKNGKYFLDELIPNPENIDSKHIFGEIKRLSVLGLIPVLGGVSGGIFGDIMTEKKWKERVPNKIKEGSYQYLANIFLCNVGAGAALYGLEKAKITSKSARALGMIGGIILTGIIGGSAIANFIGKKCIDPLFKKKNHHSHHNEKLYSERKPEALDVGLHVDDIATVAVLSGLKWIEPALPVLYSISGYRAGIGYRNGEKT